jgi:hypothetical protein
MACSKTNVLAGSTPLISKIVFFCQALGRFFQVTETVDVNKYFLDIDKILRSLRS